MTSTIDVQKIAQALAAVSGPEHLRVSADSLAIAPANCDEVAAILRYADENRISVCPTGAGTKLGWGNPGSFLLALETSRMNTLREHPWQDMTCTVEAGCPWSAMQRALATHGQYVALDPLWPARATVGGIVATNDSGSLRLRYGSLRDLIIGMTVVLADGTVARSGGKVVKNVAGYDLHKLMTGAFGTLGVITEVTFRLHAIPRHTQSFTVSSPIVEPVAQLLFAIVDSHLSTQSLQLRSSRDHFHLDVQLAALPEVLHSQAAALSQLANTQILQLSEALPDAWNEREDLFKDPEALIVKATMLPSDIAQHTVAIRDLGGVSVAQACGVMTAAIPAAASGQLVELRQKLEAGRGSLAMLQQPGETKLSPWGTPPDTQPLMRALKLRFDPNRILNPGRFIGGI